MKTYLFLALIMLLTLLSVAHNFINPQLDDTCSGALGINIFSEGDFGSGIENVLQTDPGLAPGYEYTTDTPPNDGQYTITNNTGMWDEIWTAWVLFEDNSINVDGYMMLVNASYEPGIFYEETIDNICGNTVYEFSADIFNANRIEATDHKLPNIDFLIDGQVAFSTGDIPRNEQWNSYGFTFSAPPGSNSIKLALRNNAPGGIGNDLALDNIEFRPCGPEGFILPQNTQILCEEVEIFTYEAFFPANTFSETFIQWEVSEDGGIEWWSFPPDTTTSFEFSGFPSGEYYIRFLYANSVENLSNYKCRFISNRVKAEVLQREFVTIDTICEGLTFEVGGKQFVESGVYRDTFFSSRGCDSIEIIDLTVIPALGITGMIEIIDPLCFGDNSGQLRITNILNGYPPYQVYIDGALKEEKKDPILITGLNPGYFAGEVVDRYGCSFIFEATLEDPIKLEVNLWGDTLIRLGEEARLYAQSNNPGAELVFTPGPSLTCSNCSVTEALLLNSTLMFVTAIDENGCTVRDSLFIEVEKDFPVFIPNIFSPDGDGVNDFFGIYAEPISVSTIKSLTIFNRWGAVIYSRNNLTPNIPSQGWDGTFLGKPLNPGVFLYTTEIEFIDGFVLKKAGTVTLVH